MKTKKEIVKEITKMIKTYKNEVPQYDRGAFVSNTSAWNLLHAIMRDLKIIRKSLK